MDRDDLVDECAQTWEFVPQVAVMGGLDVIDQFDGTEKRPGCGRFILTDGRQFLGHSLCIKIEVCGCVRQRSVTVAAEVEPPPLEALQPEKA